MSSEQKPAGSPGPSSLSLRSNASMWRPVVLKGPELSSSSEQKPAGSPAPSSVSLRSNRSIDRPVVFKGPQSSSSSEQKPAGSPGLSSLSLRSNASIWRPVVFKGPESSSSSEQKPAGSPAPSSVSLRSNRSIDRPVVFKGPQSSSCHHRFPKQKPAGSPGPSPVFLSRSKSMDHLIDLKDQESSGPSEMSNAFPGSGTNLRSTFSFLRKDMTKFMETELLRFRKSLDPSECLLDQDKDEDEEDESMRICRKSFQDITVQFMRRRNQDHLANSLQIRTFPTEDQHNVRSLLTNKFSRVVEGLAARKGSFLDQFYTDLFHTEGGNGKVITEHEVRQMESASRRQNLSETKIRCEDLFQPLPGRQEPIRKVMTMGIAGIGKTVLTQKFALDWAKGKVNQDIQFLFPITFRELNLLKGKYSLKELLRTLFPGTILEKLEEFRIMFILDSLEECRLNLDFQTNEIISDVTQSTSVEVLVANLIRGYLLPSAHIWITCRPATASWIPPELIDRVTEVRGFTDQQKDHYFRNRFREEEEANRVLSCIKASRSIYIMCQIPIFCWITAEVLKNTREGRELPKTLTAMLIYYLEVQIKMRNLKRDGQSVKNPTWSSDSKKVIMSLGKLAFQQLLKDNLIFYNSDLTEAGIDPQAAVVMSGVFTEIFKEEPMFQGSVFCFIHLSVQEFLAALYVHLMFFDFGINLMEAENTESLSNDHTSAFYESAVNMALKSPNGHLDLFLRFLLGLSIAENQKLLYGLVPQTATWQTKEKAVEYIKTKLSEGLCPERSINLFHCLNEVKENSLVEEIQQLIESRCLDTDKLSQSQWSALLFVLLTSEADLDEFQLKKYHNSEDTLLRLLPVVKASSKAVMRCCNLSEKSCAALGSVLSSPCCNLTQLDLSNNDLQDSGLELLCAGLQSQQCSLQVLRLSGCLITKEGCSRLASALRSNLTQLRELDVSYNPLGDSGVQLLTALLDDPGCALHTLKVENSASQYRKPGLQKYAVDIWLDPDTANKKLVLSNSNQTMTMKKEKQPYPKNPERFDFWKQVLSTDGLTGRSYWEVEWEGHVHVGVAYKAIKRSGAGNDCCLGQNEQSWSLSCSNKGFSGLHANEKKPIHKAPSQRVGVYLDWPAGVLSFYRVLPQKLEHLLSFQNTFTEPVYPAFRIRKKPPNSSVTLCQI